MCTAWAALDRRVTRSAHSPVNRVISCASTARPAPVFGCPAPLQETLIAISFLLFNWAELNRMQDYIKPGRCAAALAPPSLGWVMPAHAWCAWLTCPG